MTLRAEDARALANGARVNKIDDQLSAALNYIKSNAKEGNFEQRLHGLYPEVIDMLRSYGYRILVETDVRSHDTCMVYWD